MGAITKDKVTDDQFTMLLWHFDQYKKQLVAVPQSELNKYNLFERKKFNKLKEEVVKFWEELDKID